MVGVRLRKLTRRDVGIIIFIILYPITKLFLNQLPNPMVSGGILAFNMILPVLCGFLYGPMSGFVSGATGLGISTLIFGSLFDAGSVLPSAIMGYTAGVLGNKRGEFISSLSIFIGHGLNLVFFYRIGAATFNPDQLYLTLLGILSESTIDIVLITLLGFVLKKKLYEVNRW